MTSSQTATQPALTDIRSPLPPPGVQRMPQLRALTSVRAGAALYVAMFHMVRPFALWGVLAGFVSAGYVGVSFFFLLSGFILTYTHGLEYAAGMGDARRFWVARFARVYPVYLLITLWIGYLALGSFYPRYRVLAYVADLLMVQSWSIRMVPLFNVVGWTLSVEAFFYFVFPFVVLRMRPATLKRALLIFAACYGAVLLICATGMAVDPEAAWLEVTRVSGGHNIVFALRRYPILHLPEFLCGIALGWLYLQHGVSQRLVPVLLWTGLGGSVLALALSPHLPFLFLHNGLLIPLFAMLILGLTQANVVTKLLSVAPLLLLGEASYALYLLHFPFNDLMHDRYGWPMDVPFLLLRLLILVPVSIALHLLVERPGRRVVLRWWAARRTPAATAI